jgi:hypothetical protein
VDSAATLPYSSSLYLITNASRPGEYKPWEAASLGKDPVWFIVGSQGRPVISQGTLWLVLIAALLSYLSLTVWRASKTSPGPLAAGF